jgi:hypothetical protein
MSPINSASNLNLLNNSRGVETKNLNDLAFPVLMRNDIQIEYLPKQIVSLTSTTLFQGQNMANVNLVDE